LNSTGASSCGQRVDAAVLVARRKSNRVWYPRHMRGRTFGRPSLVYVIPALGILLLFSVPPSYSASPSPGQNIIVQHVYAIPSTGTSEYAVNLPLSVRSGDLLVVGAVFGSVDTGTVSDTLSNSFSGQQNNRSTVCYPCASNLGTGIWWSISKSSGNDTVNVRGLNSTELVEIFEIAGANSSTIGLGGGGGHSPNPGINAVTAGQDVHDGTAFVLVIGGSADGNQSNVTCYPYGAIDNTPAQSPGFTIEPYCGTPSPFTGGLVFGEYGIGNNTGTYTCQPSGNSSTCSTTGPGFTADLGVNPPLAGYVLGQAFWVDPALSTTGLGTTITTQTRSVSTSLTTSTHTLGGTSAVQTPLTTSSTTSLANGTPDAFVSYVPYIAIAAVAIIVAIAASVALLHRRSK
jgi:hypothetical protein